MGMYWKKMSALSLALSLVFTFAAATPSYAETNTPNPLNVKANGSAVTKMDSTFSTLAASSAIIDNGTVQMGIFPQGNLNVAGGTLSMGSNSTTIVGLRYIPTNGEATAPGCTCEGWGVADNVKQIAGYANDSRGSSNLTVLPGTGITATGGKTKRESAGSAYKSVVATLEGQFKVTHDYKPSASANLYEVEVTIENTGSKAVEDLRYRRVMDWDIAPNTFNEHVAIHVGNAVNVLQATTDGFQSANPLTTAGPGVGSPPAKLIPGSPDHLSTSSSDQGALFDFKFGRLEAGAKKVFKTYYGAAGTRKEALSALSKVGAEVYSFGIPRNASGAPSFDGPHIFIFAFGSVGGEAVDTIAPTTSAVLNPVAPDGMNSWYKSDVTVHLNATDNEKGSGVDKTFFRINGMGTWQQYTAPFAITVDGTYNIEYYSKDKKGNTETVKSTALKLDKTAPITKYSLIPIYATSKTGKTYVSGYTATLTATDNYSTVTGTVYRTNDSSYVPYTGPFTFYAKDTLSLDYFSTDAAGNQENPNIFDFVTGIFTGNK